MLQRFILFAWRVRFGWLLVLVVGAVATTLSIELFAVFRHLQKPVHPQVFAIMLLWFALLCLALLLGMVRRALRGPTRRWDQLPSFGRVQRVVVTVLGTASLLTPFAWIAWRIMH